MNIEIINSILAKYKCSASIKFNKVVFDWRREDLSRAWDVVVSALMDSDDEKTPLAVAIAEGYFARRPFKGFSKVSFVSPVKNKSWAVESELWISDSGKDASFLVYGRVPEKIPNSGKIKEEFLVYEKFVPALAAKFPDGSEIRKFMNYGSGSKRFSCKCAGRWYSHGLLATFNDDRSLSLTFLVRPSIIGGNGTEKTFFDEVIVHMKSSR